MHALKASQVALYVSENPVDIRADPHRTRMPLDADWSKCVRFNLPNRSAPIPHSPPALDAAGSLHAQGHTFIDQGMRTHSNRHSRAGRLHPTSPQLRLRANAAAGTACRDQS